MVLIFTDYIRKIAQPMARLIIRSQGPLWALLGALVIISVGRREVRPREKI